VFDPITSNGQRQRLHAWRRNQPIRPRHRACELPAAGHARHLYAIDGRSELAPLVHRFRGRDLDAVCEHRADAVNADISNQPGVANYLPVGDTQALRVMPTVGLEYRYPFINVQPWGSTTIEPIAQVIIRPNESYAGKLPNEDAQSMTFDTSNLFSVEQVLRL